MLFFTGGRSLKMKLTVSNFSHRYSGHYNSICASHTRLLSRDTTTMVSSYVSLYSYLFLLRGEILLVFADGIAIVLLHQKAVFGKLPFPPEPEWDTALCYSRAAQSPNIAVRMGTWSSWLLCSVMYIIDTETAINERMCNNPQLNQNAQLNSQIVERLTHMLYMCQNPFIERFQTAYERLWKAAMVDSTIDSVTIMDRGSILASLVAGCSTRTVNVPTTLKIGSVVAGTAYFANIRDIVLLLRALADAENNTLGLQWISQLHQ